MLTETPVISSDPQIGQLTASRGPKRPDLLRNELLAEIFAATVTIHTNKTALIGELETLSYGELDRRANALARGLARQGVTRGDVVGLWYPRGIDLLVAQLAITKAGAAWLPFDADVAIERIGVCLADCEARGLLAPPALQHKASGKIDVLMWHEAELADPANNGAIDLRALGVTPDDRAYLIYTSGSTGMPKGIAISHRNICHYLRSANETYLIRADDRVFQGCSAAFDLSMEEIWVPFLVGATLWVASAETIADSETLPQIIAGAGITVLDTVPTLLGLMARDIPSLRIIILGGEACPPSLAERWCKPGRTIFNSYGPTEATVVATVDIVEQGAPVTIGTPIANYTAYVVSENLQPVAPGTQGELLIGGPGVALGYVMRPELTAEKFIANPFTSDGSDPILYRSGDAVSLGHDGKILFHGRIDDQVKIRGFRVELREIESKLSALPGIHQAAVILRKDDGIERLVAFFVPSGKEAPPVADLRSGLARQLPPYMVPTRFETVEALPRLAASGKVDRKALALRPLQSAPANDVQEEPRTPVEAALLAAMQQVFPGQTLPLEGDFFTEIGGHSLLAARFVSLMRADQRFVGITLQDMYEGRSIAGIAERLERRGLGTGGQDRTFEPPPLLRRFLCGLAQAAVLPVILFFTCIQWLGIFTTFLLLDLDVLGFWGQLLSLLGIYVVLTIATTFVGIAGKWLSVGRVKPGRYPLWGVYYFRVWLAMKFTLLVKPKWFQGTPIMRVYMRIMGARIGKDAIISEFEAGTLDLLTIGDRVSTGTKLKIANVEVVGNEMVIGRVVIEDDAYIGTSSVLEHDTIIGKGAEIGDLTAVLAGTHVGAWEKWEGSPARKVSDIDERELPPQAEASVLRKNIMTCAYVIALLTIPPIGLLPIFPAFGLFDHMDLLIAGWSKADTLSVLPLLTWPTSMALIVFTIAITVAMRWIILPTRLQPGRYSVHSSVYFRKWALALLTDVKLETLSSLFATAYMRLWYRMMGTKIGRGAEISTNLSGRYDLVEIGAGNFIADEVLLGDEDIRRGWMTLEKVTTGDRVFVGNDAVVPPGTRFDNDSLLGIKSVPPASRHIKAGETWFGSPSISFPTRQRVTGISANWTYEPPLSRKIGRLIFEAFHTSFPTMLFITLGYYTVETLDPLMEQRQWGLVFWLFLVASIVIPLIMTSSTIIVKWLFMGAYKPVIKPMWSFWAMRTEACAVLYWGLAGRVLLDSLRGTPFLPWILRLYGVKIGKGICMFTTDITEFDCVTIGDYCTINSLSALQTHLYEDRLMKVGRVLLGTGVNVGAGATVLYDTKIGDFADVGSLCVVMKGETLPAHTAWVGAPAQPHIARAHTSANTPHNAGLTRQAAE